MWRLRREADTWLVKQAEKIQKMKNPNYKLSQTRILLKNINKDIDEDFLKRWVFEMFEGEIKSKQLKTEKLLKGIKLLKDGEKSKGVGFIEFAKSERALFFIRKIASQQTTLSDLINRRKELPIIEFSFEDVKRLRKIEDIKEKVKKQQKREQKDNLTKEDKGKKFDKPLQNNRRQLAKKLVFEAINKNDEEIAKNAVVALENLKSRGIKQRLFKKLHEKFKGLSKKVRKAMKAEKKETKEETKEEGVKVDNEPVKRKKKIKKDNSPRKDELIKTKISVKEKNKQKRKKMNEMINELDNFEKKFIKNFNDKNKWTEDKN